MMKKILFLLTLLIILFSCKTTEKSITTPSVYPTKGVTTEKIKPSLTDVLIIKKKLSDNVLSSVDSNQGDFASFILYLIDNKSWNELANFSDTDLFNSYMSNGKTTVIDFCTFVLYTAEKGLSTNYSINDIDRAFYTNSYSIDNTTTFEGEYIYPSGENEFFKIIITEDESGLKIIRE